MKKYHEVENIVITEGVLTLLIDGKEHSFALAEISQKLAEATSAGRAAYEISPSGYGIHWPLLDEDLSIDGLLGIKHHPQTGRTKAAV